MQSYADLMFTDAVQAEQETLGVREKYQKVYRNRFTGGLDEDAIAFIQSRTSFYMATVSETGWPYVQHRGGPAGFSEGDRREHTRVRRLSREQAADLKGKPCEGLIGCRCF